MTTNRRRPAVILPFAAGGIVGAAVSLGIVVAVSRAIGGPVPDIAYDPPRFVEETSSAGIDHVYNGEFHFFVGGGVAAFDCDTDLKPDLFLAGGINPSGLYRNKSPIGGSLQFEQVHSQTTELTEVTAAYPLDIDSDGLVDLAALRLGENVLLRGLGDCRFERANELWSVDGGRDWTVAFSATWEHGERMPTLAFGNYLAVDESGNQTGGCSDQHLLRPRGTEYGLPDVLSPGWCTLSILFSDWDRSGRRDLRVTNDRHYYRDGEEQLWRVEHGQQARLYTHADGWQSMQIWGMGIASYDLTGDGKPEVFLTSQSDNKLQTLTSGTSSPTYEDIAFRLGATAHRPYTGDVERPSTAWHPQFDDVNNDSFIDLFISKGNVEAMTDYAARDPNNLLLGNPDGIFTESAVEAGIVNFATSRGAALTDLNLDGMLDLVVVARRQPVKAWRNVGWGQPTSPIPMGDWVAVRLEQPAPNRNAVGAWVEVRVGRRTLRREVTVGGGHAGGQLGWLHFGLGDVDTLEIRVQWPDGETGPWMNSRSNGFLIVRRDVTNPLVWRPMGEDQ
ncbi:MAG: CRTAC1 family protein [Actinomycetota bacterium]